MPLYKAPRGTQDILPSEQPYWRFITQKAEALCQLYGYKRIDTPVFEETRLFSRSIGEGTDIVEKEMYTFTDQGKTMITLRPEGTAPVCRAYLEHGLHNAPQPVRVYYLTSIFRYERPQSGRYRQHQQFGCEALGVADPALDAEIIDLVWQFYISVGLRDLTLHLNSIGCPDCRPNYLQALKHHYSQQTGVLCQDCKVRLERNPLRLLDCKNPSCQEIIHSAPKITDFLCEQCAEHFQQVKEYLQDIDIPFTLNPYLVRGLDYYARTVFEVQPGRLTDVGQPTLSQQSTIGGGGRYDLLIEELGGNATPAVGFATGLERIILNLKKQNIVVPPIPEPMVYVAYTGEEGKHDAVKIAAVLRRAGIGAILSMGKRSLKAQLKQANVLGASQAIIIGEDEQRRGMIVLRDLIEGKQREVPYEGIAEAVLPPIDSYQRSAIS